MNIDKKFYNFILNMSNVKIIDTDSFHWSLEFEKVKFLFIIYNLWYFYVTFDVKLVFVMRENSKDQR